MSDGVLEPRLEIAPEMHVVDRFIGKSPAAVDARAFAKRAATSDLAVLLRGETGSGKNFLAETIHLGGRRERPFVIVDCGALPETLLEAELFGHTRGAFTSAVSDNAGLIRQAADGTLFINEIGNMSPTFQAKLLGILDDRAFRPIGGGTEFRLMARVIAATNAPLEERVREGSFRADLFHRLNVVSFALPPLRERVEDIPLLVSAALNGDSQRFAPEAIAEFQHYPWPGNIRELRNAARRIALLAERNPIDRATVAEQIRVMLGSGLPVGNDAISFPRQPPSWQEVEEAYYTHLIAMVGNVKAAAEVAGVSIKTVYMKIGKYGLQHLVRRVGRSTRSTS